MFTKKQKRATFVIKRERYLFSKENDNGFGRGERASWEWGVNERVGSGGVNT